MEFSSSEDTEEGSGGPRQAATSVFSGTSRDLGGATEDVERMTGIEQMRKQLEAFASSTAAVPLDPLTVGSAPWAGRHSWSLRSEEFEALKRSIAAHGGNVVPILVRQTAENTYEIVYGRRRRQACAELGLPVNAVIWHGDLSEVSHFLLADGENRLRADPSAYEQGVSYLAALDAGLFPSRRTLADASGVSHTWVNKAICVAELPAVVLDCCVSPTQIQPRHAQAITTAIAQDPESTLARAAQIKADGARLSPGKLLDALTGKPAGATARGDVTWRGKRFGAWQFKQGKMLLTLTTESMTSDDAARVAEAVGHALRARPSQRIRKQPVDSGLQMRLDE